jgi:non-specific serine/threonine protein kinase/serine/threonine-protein kinase
MNPDEIFHKAIHIADPAKQVAYLDDVCKGDQRLQADVEELLRAHEQASVSLGVPAVSEVPTLEKSGQIEGPGTRIGRYEVLELIGEGGMGLVYLAEQKTPVRRRVALKIIKPGMDSKQVIARFEAERQALALLDHPNIAHVFDAGATKTGRPYFVMEYVKGMSIIKYCDEHKLGIEERLELFKEVCEGVHHAHQKGIIHRDIKPSNILVSVHGDKVVPKIIDFGIAKATAQALTDKTFFTCEGQLLGTPEYMSPEQVDLATQDIDIRSDIYSLGAVLYELLTGISPFDSETLREGGIEHIRHVIREEEPKTPSTRLTSLGEQATKVARQRRTEVGTLARRLHKELEWIPLKAMRKERARRYRSASELADDIGNYLQGAPLIAGPESTVYWVRKFVRRNRAFVSGVAAVLGVLMAGIVASTLFAVRAEYARAEAQAVSDFLRNDLLASVDLFAARDPNVTVRSLLDTASEKLEGKFSEQPLVEGWIRQTLGETYRSLGLYEPAESHLEHALDIYRARLGAEDHATLACMMSLGWVYFCQSRYEQAESQLSKALQVKQHLLGQEHPEVVLLMILLGRVYNAHGSLDQAEQVFRQALATAERVLVEGHPDTLLCMSSLAKLYKDQSRYDRAEPLYVKMLDICRRVLGKEHPDTLVSMNNLATLYIDQGRYEEAEPLCLDTLEIRQRVLGEEHPDTLVSMNNLALLYQQQGRYEEAEPLYNETLEIRRRVLGPEHPDSLRSMNNLAGLYKDHSRYEDAESLYVQTLEIRGRVLGDEHPDTLVSMNNLGGLYLARGRYEKAEPLCSKGLEISRRVLGDEHHSTLALMNNLGVIYKEQKKYEEAEELLTGAAEGARRVLGEANPSTLRSMTHLIELYDAWGKPEEAEEWRAKLPRKDGTIE